MEKPVDEAAVWRRVTGETKGSAAPAPVGPELLELWGDMRRCASLLGRCENQTAAAPLLREQRRQTILLAGICRLLIQQAQPASGEAPSQTSQEGRLRWILCTTERTAARLEALAPRLSGLPAETAAELADAQRQLWRREVALLGQIR